MPTTLSLTPEELRSRYTAGQVRDVLSNPSLSTSPATLNAYAGAFPELSEQINAILAEMNPPTPTPAASGAAPATGPAPTVPYGTTPTGGSTTSIPGTQPFESETDAIIAGLLNPPAYFADVDRRAAEVAAGRGISGSEAGFGTGLRMTDEERIRRQTLGTNLLGAREEAARADTTLANATRELDLREEQVRADIALGNRTAANQEELTRIQRERAQLEEDRLQLERDIQQRLGTVSSGGRGGGQQINIAGTGWPANWVDWPL